METLERESSTELLNSRHQLLYARSVRALSNGEVTRLFLIEKILKKRQELTTFTSVSLDRNSKVGLRSKSMKVHHN